MTSITKSKKMPDELRRKVELMTPMQRKYCEFRSTGLKQSEAAEKAGSTATTTESRGRVGWNIENTVDGADEYINWLQELRAEQACVDSIEIIEKLRRVYDDAMANGKYTDANRATQLLAEMAGFLGKDKGAVGGGSTQEAPKDGPKNKVEAFREGGETPEERARKIRSLLKNN
jgi:hypothetical protein